jgi:hypothetical protein
MKLGEVYRLAEFLEWPEIDFIAVWKDNFHEDDSHDGESAGFRDPRTAFALAKEKAQAVGMFGTTYAVEACIADDVRVTDIEGYFATITDGSAPY